MSSAITMADSLVSARLTAVGLPAMNNVSGNPTGTDPYAAPPSAITQLSGYGQLLSATSTAAAGLETLQGAATNHASSSTAGVVVANANNSAAYGSYNVVVNQLAQAQVQESTQVIADPAASMFGPGSFTLRSGTGENAVVKTVSPAGTTLNDLVTAINGANAGVTASVVAGQYGSTLRLTANQTGAGSNFSLTGPQGDPFNQWGSYLSQLGLQTTVAAQDASYSVNGVAATSASNTGVVIDGTGNTTVNLQAAGSTTVTVAAPATVPQDLSAVTTAANKFVQTYNALMGTTVQLTGTGGALNGDTLANQLSTDLYQATQATYSNGASSLTQLSQLGLTTTSGTSAMALNTTTLNSAFAGDGAGVAQLLTTVTNALHAMLNGYTGESGSIMSNVTSTQTNMAFIDGQAASAYSNLSGTVKQHLLQWSLNSVDTPPALPSINIFA